MFLNYGCLFYDKNGWDVKTILKATTGDLVLVCDGETPVAIAKMQSPFFLYDDPDNRVKLCNTDYRSITDGGQVISICKAQIILFDNEQKRVDWGNDPQKRFCSYGYPDYIKEKWDTLHAREGQGEFSIKSEVCSLTPSPDTQYKPLISDKRFYRIPVYQRPYSWGDDEIRRVFEDMRASYQHDKEVTFMGTMQLSNGIYLSRKNDPNPQISYDIIDGQQRLTTFTIILCLLEKITGKSYDDSLEKRFITHVNRGSAQLDLEAFWTQLREFDYQGWEQFKMKWGAFGESINPYLRNAACICGLLEEYFLSPEENEQMPPADVVDRAKQLYAYLENSLRFVVIETRAGLSKTLKIFNSINTAGLDLGVHDLFKLRLYEHRKNVGDGESVFDRISGIYEQLDEHNRQMGDQGRWHLHMWTVLEVYQRFLVVTHGMSRELYGVSMPRFFDRLFETILGTRKWEEFANYQDLQLDLSDLEKIVKCMKIWAWKFNSDERLRIIHRFIIQDTRYISVWNYTILALCFDAITEDEIVEFHESLFKLLVPPSLYWSKGVSEMKSALVDTLKAIKQEKNGIQKLHSLIESGGLNGKAKNLFDDVCNKWQLTDKTKWKNLVCRLVEYLQSDKKQTEEQLFSWIDIEHIQCYTDQSDRDKVWNEWGEELNKMGNLVILEGSLNRSIGNNHSKKKAAYSQSAFYSVKQLVEKVDNWKLSDAEARRQRLQIDLWEYLSNNS